jgi:hypothetical protein
LPTTDDADLADAATGQIQVSGLDEILELASKDLPSAGVTCLLVGGFAVNHYGYTRNTLDVDFMIVSERVDDVRRILSAAGFSNVSISETVAFFSKPDLPWRVDFLRVDETTMRKLDAGAEAVVLHGHALRVPSLQDLLAMKIFALAQSPVRRVDKDLPDIAYLAVLNDLDSERDLLPLCQRFGTEEVYRQIVAKIGALSS